MNFLFYFKWKSQRVMNASIFNFQQSTINQFTKRNKIKCNAVV